MSMITNRVGAATSTCACAAATNNIRITATAAATAAAAATSRRMRAHHREDVVGAGQHAGRLRCNRIESIAAAAADALIVIRLVVFERAAARLGGRADRADCAAEKPTADAIATAVATAAVKHTRPDKLATRLALESALGRSFARGARATHAAARTGPRQIGNDQMLLFVIVLFEALQTVLFVAQSRLGAVGLFRVDLSAVRELRGRPATLALMAAGAAVERARRTVQQHLLVDAERHRRVHCRASLGRPRGAPAGRVHAVAAVDREKLRAVDAIAAAAAAIRALTENMAEHVDCTTRRRVSHLLHGGVAQHAHHLREKKSEIIAKRQGKSQRTVEIRWELRNRANSCASHKVDAK